MLRQHVLTGHRMLVGLCAVLIAFMLWSPAQAAPRLALAVGISASGITVPEEVEGGLTTITMSNTDVAPHLLAIGRLKDGETPESFGAAAAADPNAVLGLIESGISPGFQVPGGTTTLVAELRPGTWVAADFLAPASPIFFTVTEGDGDGTAVPQAAAEVGLVDFGFTGLPASLPAGRTTIKLTNNGMQGHEMFVYRLEDGQSGEQFAAAAAESEGNVPNEYAGGAAMTEGASLWTDYSLAAGNYVAVCFVPDSATGTPHVALGMMTTFSVTEGAAPATMPATGADTPIALTLMGWGALFLLVGLAVRAAYIRTR